MSDSENDAWLMEENQNTPPAEPFRLCWLCGSAIGEIEAKNAKISHTNLRRAVEILKSQQRNAIPSVMAIRDAIAYLQQV